MISLSSRARSAAFRVWPFSPGWYGRRFANRFSKPLSCTFDLETWISYSAELIKSTIGWSFIAQQKVASMELGNVKTSQRQKTPLQLRLSLGAARAGHTVFYIAN